MFVEEKVKSCLLEGRETLPVLGASNGRLKKRIVREKLSQEGIVRVGHSLVSLALKLPGVWRI